MDHLPLSEEAVRFLQLLAREQQRSWWPGSDLPTFWVDVDPPEAWRPLEWLGLVVHMERDDGLLAFRLTDQGLWALGNVVEVA